MKDMDFAFYAETVDGSDLDSFPTPQEAVDRARAMAKEFKKPTQVRISMDNIATLEPAVHEEVFPIEFDVKKLVAEVTRLRKLLASDLRFRIEMLDETEIAILEGAEVIHSIGAMDEGNKAMILSSVSRLCDIGNEEWGVEEGPHDAVKELFVFLHKFDGMFTFEELDDLLTKAANWLEEN